MDSEARGRGVCVAVDRSAAEAGLAMLDRGGNAIDAAIAAGFVEAVISPNNCGIGGYGAAGIGWLAGPKRLVAIDADAVAPAAATPGMFPTIPTRDPNGYKMAGDSHKAGPLSVAVPGVLGGLLTALESWGRLPRAVVMEPAIRLAREGPTLTPGQALGWARIKAKAEGRTGPVRVEPGPLPMPRLAEALQAIAEGGADAFYSGPIGRAIAGAVRKAGGILTEDDLAAYRALVVEPVSLELAGARVATVPPPSGGLTSLQIAALLERIGPGGGRFETFLEVLKVAWEDRLTTLADPRWMTDPPGNLLAAARLDRLEASAREGLARPGPGRLVAPDPLRGTVHLAAADAEGNVFSWTQTHGGGFGSGLMVPEYEVVLGHGMCRFDPRPGWPNSIAPGKRPLHNMAPTLAIRDGRAILAVGAAGGRTIINNVANLLAAILVEGKGSEVALARPRLQCETIEPASLEEAAGPEVFAELRARGHRITPVRRDAGLAHLIVREGDAWHALAEPRSPAATALGLR